jgi:uncharacterized protein
VTKGARFAYPALRIVAIVCALGGLLLIFEKRFIYFPTRDHETTPSALGLPHEDVRLVAEDGVRIHGWYLPVREPRWVTLVSHGNGGNISHRLDRALLLQQHLRSSVFLYDYRGYGASEGSPDEAGTYRDARAAYRWLVEQKRVRPDELVLFGESLGSAVALELALERPAAALVLEAPFTSVPDVARRTIFAPLAPFVRTRYESLARIPRLRMPLLVMQGDRDEVIPPALGRRLFDAAPEPKRYYAIPGAGHNDTYIVGGAAYWQALSGFLDHLTRARAAGTMSENG